MNMKTLRKGYLLICLALVTAALLAGCARSAGGEGAVVAAPEDAPVEEAPAQEAAPSAQATGGQLYVRFGNSQPFTLYLYDNPTAAAIAGHVGSADWQLPIYHYDDYDNWQVMQYYDIPSRYQIPSDAQSVASEQAGTVYYSHPNRIILFFGDAQVAGDYTPVGYFEATEDFISAVENNPVLEGWGNKLVHISAQG